MRFSFHPEAVYELTQSAKYYQKLAINLGNEFLDDVFSTILRIIEFPDAFPKLSRKSRKCLVNRFPFAIIYQVREEEIFIVAVTHLSRKPGYWKKRVK